MCEDSDRFPKFGNAQSGSGIYENSSSALLAPFSSGD
jgi:hypothetical protein